MEMKYLKHTQHWCCRSYWDEVSPCRMRCRALMLCRAAAVGAVAAVLPTIPAKWLRTFTCRNWKKTNPAVRTLFTHFYAVGVIDSMLVVW